MGLSSASIESIWFTLVGLKLLETYYRDSKATWRLVANKGRKAFKAICGLQGNVDVFIGLLANMNISYLGDKQ